MIRVKYADYAENRLKFIEGGDWIDVFCERVSVNGEIKDGPFVQYNVGDTVLVDLGVAMELPEKHEAHLLSRSSTFRKYGLIQTNSMGIIDNAYRGDNDWWSMEFYATRKSGLQKGVRIGQFRLVKNMAKETLIEVLTLGNDDRGGRGSTGEF